jgi:hypothetical protein
MRDSESLRPCRYPWIASLSPVVVAIRS